MYKLKIGIPTIMLALSSYALTPCNAKNNIQLNSEQKKEMVIQQAPSKDSFEKTNETKNSETPFWIKTLLAAGGIGILAGLYRMNLKYIDKLKDDPVGARIYLDMLGDNYLDS